MPCRPSKIEGFQYATCKYVGLTLILFLWHVIALVVVCVLCPVPSRVLYARK
jgi:hypothetical protein